MGDLWLSLILSTLLALLALWRRAITYPGTALAWCFSVVICYCGGWVDFCALAATLVFTLVAGKISGKTREKAEIKLHAKHGRRDSVQIICNVGMSALMVLLYAVTKHDAFLCASGAALAASLADSMASELGILSKRGPRDACTFKKVQPGMSGGVSAFGFAMSGVGAAIIGAVCLGQGRGWLFSLVIFVSGFAAAYIDSLLGSAVQAKYRCGVCGALTEKKTHCGVTGVIEKGWRFIDNDAVNFLNNLSGAVIALVLWWLIG